MPMSSSDVVDVKIEAFLILSSVSSSEFKLDQAQSNRHVDLMLGAINGRL
jgi:hypothetical protein